MRRKDIADNNVHVIPRIKVKGHHPAIHAGFVIAWRDDNGSVQERNMTSHFLARRWAKQIAESRGVEAIEHFVALE